MKKKTSSFAKKIAKLSLGLAACAAVTVTAYAVVNYDPATGGFVGKGDVQTQINLNNTQMQVNYSKVEFLYEGSATYQWVCEWYTGPDQNQSYHSNTRQVSVGVPSTPVFDDPKNTKNKNEKGNLTGWYLDAIGNVTIPEMTEDEATCPTENANQLKSVKAGSFELASSPTGGLSFTYEGTTYPLPNTL